MSNLTDTLKLALDALEDVEAGQQKVIDAITALREVLDHIEERLEMVEPAQERRVQQQFMDEEVLYLYTPRREWVSLTDDEFKALWDECRPALPRYLCFASAIEAKLKEKNCGS